MPHFGAVCSELLTTFTAAAAAKSLQSCSTLCDPIDGSLPGSTVLGILQARTLEWVAISFSSAWKWKVKVKSLSRVQLLATPWTAAYQAPQSMGFSRQEYWSGVPLPSPNNIHYIILNIYYFSSTYGKSSLCYFLPPILLHFELLIRETLLKCVVYPVFPAYALVSFWALSKMLYQFYKD